MTITFKDKILHCAQMQDKRNATYGSQQLTYMKNPFAPSSRLKNRTKEEKKDRGREKEGSISLVHLMQ